MAKRLGFETALVDIPIGSRFRSSQQSWIRKSFLNYKNDSWKVKKLNGGLNAENLALLYHEVNKLKQKKNNKTFF